VSQIGDIKGTVIPSPFIARSKEQPIKVRSTDGVDANASYRYRNDHRFLTHLNKFMFIF